MLFHPDIYFKDCDLCRKYIMSDGEPITDMNGNRIERVKGEKPNCKMCDKSNMQMLSDRNWLTWHLYQRHKYVGLEDFEKRDSLVQRHMIMIGEIDRAAQIKHYNFMGAFNG